MSKNKELFSNVLIFGIGTMGAKLIQFVLVPLYTIYMTTSEYSTSDLIVSTVTLIMPLFTLGISDGVLRFVLGKKENQKSIAKLIVYITFCGTLLLSAFIPLLNRIEMFCGYGYMIPALYFAYSLKTLFSQFCKGIEKNVVYAIDGIISSLSLTVLSIVFISILKMGIMGYLISVLISRVISILYLSLACKNIGLLKYSKIDRKLTKELINYSLPLMPNNMSWWIIQMSDRYLLTYFCGSALNGLYSIAYKIPSIFNLIVSIFIQAFGITAIKECDSSTSDGKIDGSYFNRIYSKYIAITFVAASIMILFTKFLASILLKKEFYDSWVYIPLLLMAYAVGNLQSFYGSIYAGIKKSKLVFFSTFMGAISNIILNICLILPVKAYGAAIATVISYIVVYLIRMHNIKKYVQMKHYEIKTILSIVLMSYMCYVYTIDIQYSTAFTLVGVISIIVVYYKELYDCMQGVLFIIKKRK